MSDFIALAWKNPGSNWLLGRKAKIIAAAVISVTVSVTGSSALVWAATKHHSAGPLHPSHLTEHPPRKLEARLKLRQTGIARPRLNAVPVSVEPYADASLEIPPDVVRAFRKAQQTVKIDPALLIGIASTESSMNAFARNHHSSARGLLQFNTVTWLTVVRDFGARHGLARYAAAITTDSDGALVVKTARLRRAILALRDDPLLESIMAAERLEQQRGVLEVRLGRPMKPADLYFLHLLGPVGAMHFLTELAQHPDASSVATVGHAAAPNAGLFMKDGRPMTLMEAYASIQNVLDERAAHYGSLFRTRVIAVADAR